LLKISVIGGSVSQAFGLEGQGIEWPSLLREQIADEADVERVSSIGFLNPGSLLRFIEKSKPSDVLIIHMGTSVGWPVIHAPLERLLRPEHRHDAAFHLPTTATTSNRHLVKRALRHTLRNLLKFSAFPLGLYRPRQSIRDLESDLESAFIEASKLASHVVWMQHRTLGYRRLFLERWVYQRYFNRIQSQVRRRAMEFENLHLVEIPDGFLSQDNFTLDGVHVSSQGHQKLATLIEKSLRAAGILQNRDGFTRFSQEIA